MEAHAFTMTWKAYAETLRQDCSTPCEQCNPHNGSGIDPQHDAELDTYDLCDTCGIDGNEIKMMRCGCCQQKGQETVACLSCVPQEQLLWLLDDEDERHWRCRRCRCCSHTTFCHCTCCVNTQNYHTPPDFNAECSQSLYT